MCSALRVKEDRRGEVLRVMEQRKGWTQFGSAFTLTTHKRKKEIQDDRGFVHVSFPVICFLFLCAIRSLLPPTESVAFTLAPSSTKASIQIHCMLPEPIRQNKNVTDLLRSCILVILLQRFHPRSQMNSENYGWFFLHIYNQTSVLNSTWFKFEVCMGGRVFRMCLRSFLRRVLVD